MQKTLTEIFDETRANMTNNELIELALEELKRLCDTGGQSFTMRVPANVKDTDMIFSELINRFKELSSYLKSNSQDKLNFAKFCMIRVLSENGDDESSSISGENLSKIETVLNEFKQ